VRAGAAEEMQLLRPLLPQARRNDQQDASPVFRPTLCDDQAGLDRLTETDLIGEDYAFRNRRREREKRGIDLMRVEVYPRRRKRFRKRVIRRAFKGDAVSEVLAVIGGEIRRFHDHRYTISAGRLSNGS